MVVSGTPASNTFALLQPRTQSSSLSSLLAPPLAISAIQVSWDLAYDQSAPSLTTAVCSDGPNGIVIKRRNVSQDLPFVPEYLSIIHDRWLGLP